MFFFKFSGLSAFFSYFPTCFTFRNSTWQKYAVCNVRTHRHGIIAFKLQTEKRKTRAILKIVSYLHLLVTDSKEREIVVFATELFFEMLVCAVRVFLTECFETKSVSVTTCRKNLVFIFCEDFSFRMYFLSFFMCVCKSFKLNISRPRHPLNIWLKQIFFICFKDFFFIWLNYSQRVTCWRCNSGIHNIHLSPAGWSDDLFYFFFPFLHYCFLIMAVVHICCGAVLLCF